MHRPGRASCLTCVLSRDTLLGLCGLQLGLVLPACVRVYLPGRSLSLQGPVLSGVCPLVTRDVRHAALFSVFAAFSLYTCLMRGARILHTQLMSNVIRMPMMFFDTTPLGRTINRFSKDVDVVDNVMPMVLRGFMLTFVVVSVVPLWGTHSNGH